MFAKSICPNSKWKILTDGWLFLHYVIELRETRVQVRIDFNLMKDIVEPHLLTLQQTSQVLVPPSVTTLSLCLSKPAQQTTVSAGGFRQNIRFLELHRVFWIINDARLVCWSLGLQKKIFKNENNYWPFNVLNIDWECAVPLLLLPGAER